MVGALHTQKEPYGHLSSPSDVCTLAVPSLVQVVR